MMEIDNIDHPLLLKQYRWLIKIKTEDKTQLEYKEGLLCLLEDVLDKLEDKNGKLR